VPPPPLLSSSTSSTVLFRTRSPPLARTNANAAAAPQFCRRDRGRHRWLAALKNQRDRLSALFQFAFDAAGTEATSRRRR